MIFYFKPFSTSKELGKVYNAHCEIVPRETDWICIMDYDAMVLVPETYKIIESAIDRYQADTDIFSTYASRIGYAWQRLNPHTIDDNDSIRHHIKIAQDQAKQFPSLCEPIPDAAGFFLLFRKSYWERNKFQEEIWGENGYLFDRNFCLEASEAGRIKLILGAYIWHSYRIMKEEPRDCSHLREIL